MSRRKPVAAEERNECSACVRRDGKSVLAHLLIDEAHEIPLRIGIARQRDRVPCALAHGAQRRIAPQLSRLDPELVDAAYELLQGEADMIRASGMFGEDLLVPDGAGAQTRLLAFIGRQD